MHHANAQQQLNTRNEEPSKCGHAAGAERPRVASMEQCIRTSAATQLPCLGHPGVLSLPQPGNIAYTPHTLRHRCKCCSAICLTGVLIKKHTSQSVLHMCAMPTNMTPCPCSSAEAGIPATLVMIARTGDNFFCRPLQLHAVVNFKIDTFVQICLGWGSRCVTPLSSVKDFFQLADIQTEHMSSS